MSNDQRIRERAYEIWEKEGKPHGRDDDHWRRAEIDVAEEDTRTGSSPTKPASGGSSHEERRVTEDQPHHTVQPVTSRPLTSRAPDPPKESGQGKKKPRTGRSSLPAV
jgi:hypothetical protein